jgi:hypothetical protein
LHRFVIVEREQRVHRLLAHLERTLPDECGDVALFEEQQLGGQGVGRDRDELAALKALRIVVDEIIIVTIALSAQTEPTDRSMPPLMMTNASPSAISAMKLKFFEMLRRLRGVTNTGAKIQITTIRAANATTT